MLKMVKLAKGLLNSAIALVLALGMTACPEDDVKMGHITMALTDSPGDFDEVWIDLQGVEVNESGGNPSEGWIELPGVAKGRYNLIELVAGKDSTFLDIDYPMSYYAQFQLIIGDNNGVVIDGQEFPLPLADPGLDKIRFKSPLSIVEGYDFFLLVDFDVAKSVRETGPNAFVLYPSASLLFADTQGMVEGTINPPGERVAIYAVANSDTIKTAYSDPANGKFLLRGLSPGRYDITLEPGEASAYLPKTIPQVVVLRAETSQLGTQDLPQ